MQKDWSCLVVLVIGELNCGWIWFFCEHGALEHFFHAINFSVHASMCTVMVHQVTEVLHIGGAMYCIIFIELLLFHASCGPTQMCRYIFTVIYILMPQHWFLNTLQCPTAIQTTLREKRSCVLAAISSFRGPDTIGISKVNNAILVPWKRQKWKLTDILIALTQVLHHSGYLNAGPVNQGAKHWVKCPEAPTESWPVDMHSELWQILPMHITTSGTTCKFHYKPNKHKLQHHFMPVARENKKEYKVWINNNKQIR